MSSPRPCRLSPKSSCRRRPPRQSRPTAGPDRARRPCHFHNIMPVHNIMPAPRDAPRDRILTTPAASRKESTISPGPERNRTALTSSGHYQMVLHTLTSAPTGPERRGHGTSASIQRIGGARGAPRPDAHRHVQRFANDASGNDVALCNRGNGSDSHLVRSTRAPILRSGIKTAERSA